MEERRKSARMEEDECKNEGEEECKNEGEEKCKNGGGGRMQE